MTTYFSYLPNITVGIPETNTSIKNYVKVKNIFRRVRSKSETIRKLTYFEKYSIPGDDKPYNVSYNVYGTPEYEWIILLINDVVNIYKEWPLSSREFEHMIREKYGTQGEVEIHHWETNEIKDAKGNVIIPKGMVVNENFTKTINGVVLSGDELVNAISYYEYEMRINEQKRDIYLPYPDSIFRIKTELQTLVDYELSIDTENMASGEKNSGDDDFYIFKYFTNNISL